MTTETKVLTHAELELAMQTSAKKSDWKAVREYAKKLEESEKAQAQAERDEKLKALTAMGDKVKSAIQKAVQRFIDDKSLDFADGIWFANDFGDKLTSIRLLKSQPKAKGAGTGSGSYISRPEKTADLLNQVGSHVMFKEDTSVTIDKLAQNMKAGTTFKAAYDFSNNGGWRNRVRMALLKEAGLV